MANGTAAADSSTSSSSSLPPPSEAASSPKTGRKPRGGAGGASPWSSIVRGEADPAAPPSPPPSAAAAAVAGTILTAEVSATTADTAALARSDSSEEAAINGGNVAALPSKGEKKSAWNVPHNGAAEGRPVMGAVLWPALSESTRASPRSSSSDSLAGVSDGTHSAPPELISPAQTAKPSSNNINPNNHGPPQKQKSMKRGGKSSSTGSLANGGLAPPSPTAPLDTSQTTSTRTPAEPELSPRDHSRNNGGNWDHAPSPRPSGFSPMAHGRNEHHRSYGGGGHRRNNNAGGANHNFGTRRDQDRGSNEWNAHPNFRGRDVQLSQQHQPRPPQRPFIRPIPGPPPFVNPPSPVRAFVNPLGFPDMHPQMYYIPPPPPLPDVFRPMPYVAAPAPPIYMPHANPQLAYAVMRQIEFYFSSENLCKDVYLRQNMDGEGWVPISLVASFNRVRQLTGDINFVLEAVCTSSVLEVQGDRIRRRGDWMNWIFRPSAGSTLPSLHSSDASDNLTVRMRNIELEATSVQRAAVPSTFSGESSSHS